MTVSDEQILKRLRELLAESDLQTTTEKMLRKKLEEEFSMDLLDKKQIIRQEIEKYLAEQEGDEEEEGEDEDDEDEGDAPSKRGAKLGCILSEPLQKFLGAESLPRTEVVKRLWEYIKGNNLQDPKDRRKIVLDDKLKTIFTHPVTMFSMNAQLSKHCFTDDGNHVPRSRSKSSGGEKRPATAEKSKSTKKAKGGDEEGGDKEKDKNSGFNKPIPLSKEMASWTGQEAMSRGEVTKFFWKYVKEKNLQDAADKRLIKCDAVLKKLTGQDSFAGFSAAKYLAPHFLKK